MQYAEMVRGLGIPSSDLRLLCGSPLAGMGQARDATIAKGGVLKLNTRKIFEMEYFNICDTRGHDNLIINS